MRLLESSLDKKYDLIAFRVFVSASVCLVLVATYHLVACVSRARDARRLKALGEEKRHSSMLGEEKKET